MYRKYVALLDIPKSRIKSRPTNKQGRRPKCSGMWHKTKEWGISSQ